jgi:tetratricopeptide (TPR) repeat protein
MNFLKGVGTILAFQLLFLCPLLAGDDATEPASPSFYYTPGCIEAMKHISMLKLDKARAVLQLEHTEHPGNKAVIFLQDCADYYRLITNHDPAEFTRLEKQKQARLTAMQSIPRSSPYALYTEAEINLHWSILRLMNQEYLSGALELRTAYQLFEKNATLFPDFYPNKKSLGFIKALLGTLPENYHWILNIVGLKGDLNQGLMLVNQYLGQKYLAPDQLLEKQQADFYFVMLHFYFGSKAQSWEHCKSVTEDYAQSQLSCYLRAFVASRTAHNEEAIQALTKRPRGTDYSTYYELDLLTGYAMLNRLDDDPDIYLKKFVTFSKGSYQKKDAYRRLAWHQWILGDTLKYQAYRGLAAKFTSSPDDEDKMVTAELAKGIYPGRKVLEARLLFDGGYYERAENIIAAIKPSTLPTVWQQSEYYYRYGRILQEQKKYSRAIEMFTESIRLGEPSSSYFAPYSCLQLGYIYTKLGINKTARFYFDKTVTYKNYEARGSTAQRAKLGAQQLK